MVTGAPSLDVAMVTREKFQEILRESCRTHDARIIDHCIATLRMRMSQPAYRVGDLTFDRIVTRRGTKIGCDESGRVFTELHIGTTTITIIAGGPLIDDDAIEAVWPW